MYSIIILKEKKLFSSKDVLAIFLDISTLKAVKIKSNVIHQ